MKNLFLFSIAALASMAFIPSAALSFQSHEHPFGNNGVDLPRLGQDGANSYCNGLYQRLLRTGDLAPSASGANHVWAHLEQNTCVYNKNSGWW